MSLKYHSTRDKQNTATASQAILQGLATDGGLYVPEKIPKLDKTFSKLAQMSYAQVAYEVMKLFLDDFTEEELKTCIDNAYNEEKFDNDYITTLVEADGAYYLELYHGRTIAFKDMALSILPYLLTTAAKKNNIEEKIVILTATSGDTGKAALAGFAHVPGTEIIVFYPKDGVSRVQELQMVTQKGDNTHVIAVHGNFDDAQNGVKEIFNDKELAARLRAKGCILSSANSINIGRLVPQIAYYVYAYTRLMPEKINFVVPTGNFGNILAAYYAKQMGVPVNKLICASNDNKVLYDFFSTGTYDRNREFILTESPSMDILISSNLERLIYDLAGDKTEQLMKSLTETGKYEITDSMREKLEGFYGGFADGHEMAAAIRELYKKEEYVIDTHTAIAAAVYKKYKEETNDDTTTVIVSTASPYKFAGSVLNAIKAEKRDYNTGDFMQPIRELNELSQIRLPKAVTELEGAEIRHTQVCDRNQMEEVVEKILNQ